MSWEDDIIENLKFGLVEIMILALLSKEEMYGYQIKQELTKRTDHGVIVKDGSLYGSLYRMEERGLISSRRELVGEKRFRNYYRIEPAGREYLNFAYKQFLSIYGGADKLFKGVFSE